jgi:D-alanyl-lipoteichoic acid acyltransferase DltB (MBOAT superfamily)
MALGMSKLGWIYFETLIIRISRDIAEFWRRWHISLSLGFGIIYIFHLGGSKGSKMKQVRNVFIIFVVSGFGMELIGHIYLFINALYFTTLLLNKTVLI